jgi:putative endonuclease
MQWYVYILKSLSVANWHYIGQTGNLDNRLKTHNAGRVRSTRKHLPVEIAYTETFETQHEAKVRERHIKRSAWQKKKIYLQIDQP